MHSPCIQLSMYSSTIHDAYISANHGTLMGAVNNLLEITQQNQDKIDTVEIAHKSIYGAHLRMLLKIHLKMQTDAKSEPLKHGGKGALFSAPVDYKGVQMEQQQMRLSVRMLIQLGVHLAIHLEVHLMVHCDI